MPFFAINNNFEFPAPHFADEDGLLVIGGLVTAEKVLEAYHSGIFPWYNDNEPVLWWSPDPRFVLFPDELHISKSMQKLLKKEAFTFTINNAFAQVMHHCKTVKRAAQDGTWITSEMEMVYNELHQQGHALSGEVWQQGELVGGVYGVIINQVFCAESMFSLASNASKFALIRLIQLLKERGTKLIDCQVYSEHVQSLGARLIPRDEFLNYISAD